MEPCPSSACLHSDLEGKAPARGQWKPFQQWKLCSCQHSRWLDAARGAAEVLSQLMALQLQLARSVRRPQPRKMVTGECRALLCPRELQWVPGNQTVQTIRSWSLMSQMRSWCYHFVNTLQGSSTEVLEEELNHQEMLLQELTTQIWISMTSLWIRGIQWGPGWND